MLQVWGCGQFGQHGRNSRMNVSPGVVGKLKDERVVLVSCGASHTMAYTESKKLYGWGNNSNGQLGIKRETVNKDIYEMPQLIDTYDAGIIGMNCGSQHSYIWFQDGQCIRFGQERNQSDDILDENRGNHCNEVQWISAVNSERHILQGCMVKEVASGARHALYLLDDGQVLASGANNRGQLGTCDKIEASVPKRVPNIPGTVKHVACGNFHSLCLTDEGEVYNWGYGPGCGSDCDVISPASVELEDEMLIKLVAGDSHSLALSIHGTVFGWGSNSEGQLGKNSGYTFQCNPINLTNKFKIGPSLDISCRDDTIATLLQDGRLYFWGKNMWDVLAGGSSTNRFIRKPFEIKIGEEKVRKIAIGSWHVAVVSSVQMNTGMELTGDENHMEENSTALHASDHLSKKKSKEEQSSFNQSTETVNKHRGIEEILLENEVNPVLQSDANNFCNDILMDLELDESHLKKDARAMTDSRIVVDLKTPNNQNTQITRSHVERNLDFAFECVQRENSLYRTSLKTPISFHTRNAFPRSHVKTSESFGYLPVLNSTTNKNSSNFVARKPKAKKLIVRTLQGYDTPSHKGESWEDETEESHLRNPRLVSHKHHNQTEAEPETIDNPISNPLSTWDIQSILDMTSRSQKPRATNRTPCVTRTKSSSRIRVNEKDDVTYRRTISPRKSHEHLITFNSNRLATLCNVQSLELSKLRGNEDWKKNKYSRSLMKN